MPPILHEQAVISQSAPAVSNNPTQLLVNDSSSTEKTVIAAQRERTINLHINKFASYFHPRLVDAAKEIGVCSTVLKKVRCKYCMKKWPYRRQMQKVQKVLRWRMQNKNNFMWKAIIQGFLKFRVYTCQVTIVLLKINQWNPILFYIQMTCHMQ